MGLIGRVIERGGIPTVGVSTMLKFSEVSQPPRTLFLKWPMGHAMGEVGFKEQQTLILKRALNLLIASTERGFIDKPGYRWRRREDLELED